MPVAADSGRARSFDVGLMGLAVGDFAGVTTARRRRHLTSARSQIIWSRPHVSLSLGCRRNALWARPGARGRPPPCARVLPRRLLISPQRLQTRPRARQRQTRVDHRPEGRALTPSARGLRPAAALRFTRRAVLCPPRCSGTSLHTRAVNDTRGPILGHLAAEATDRPAPSRLRASGRAVTEKARTSGFGVRSARRCPDARNGVPSRRTRRLSKSRIRDDRVAEVRRRRRAFQTMAPQRSRPGAGGRDRRDTTRPTLTHQGHVLVRRL